jgi:hypothetical protein
MLKLIGGDAQLAGRKPSPQNDGLNLFEPEGG